MRGIPTTFWAKLQRDDKDHVVAWHPLLAHSADVAACAEALLERTILRRRLATLAGRVDLGEVDIARLSALAALHDIGKCNLGFQGKRDAGATSVAGHVSEVLDLLGSDYQDKIALLEALSWADLERWCPGGGSCELLIAAIGHHGRPVACGANAPKRSLWRAEGSLDPFAGIASLSSAVRAWFPAAFAASRDELPDKPELQHAFAGLVMLADWLGSDCHDHCFPYADDLEDRMPFARERARCVIAAIGLDATRSRAALGLSAPGFDRVSRYLPHDAQSRTMALPSDAAGSLTVIESETGSGKTEAALGRFLQLFHAGLVDGMTFALPTRTAATQLHGRVWEAMCRAFPDQATRPPVVLAVPGYLQVDDVRGQRLPGFEVLWNDDQRERTRHRGWAAEQPKRFLAGAVVVGTIDQVLLSSLRVGHAHLRATALLRHLLVVDEVHASDAYMNRILEEVLRFHLGAGGHVLLMSATLGCFVRGRLVQAAQGRGLVGDNDVPLAEALATRYPAIHHAPRGGVPGVVAVETPGPTKLVRVALEPVAGDPHAIVARALDAARAGARVLVLRNTVRDAVETQIALEALATAEDAALLFRVGEIATLHHARFAKTDRELLDQAIEMGFGKQAPAKRGVVAVATQTVQQSLDLDADLLFTDLAPMDVLLQRFGRVHRHPERHPHRPCGFDVARAVVMTGREPLDECLRATGEACGPHGAGTVYDNLLILEATRQRLARGAELHIPGENRELVEVTTHPEALQELATRLGEAWVKHWQNAWGRWFAHVNLAKLNLVERHQRFGKYSFKRTDIEERIPSRLGESDRRARFAEPPVGPFGGRVSELTLPGWLVRGAPPDPDLVPTEIRSEAGPFGMSLRFVFGGIDVIYDRLGLRPAPAAAAAPDDDMADA